MHIATPTTLPTALDRLIPAARLVETDWLELAAPPSAVWQRVRHGDLAMSPLARLLFAIRTFREGEPALRVDGFTSTPERPGFHLLVDDPPHELAVGAIGQVWRPRIPFVYAPTVERYAEFSEPGFAKVAWGIRLLPRPGGGTLLELAVRVATTDPASWLKFQRYFRVIGIGSRFIRRLLLTALRKELGEAGADDNRPLPGDELLTDATGSLTHAIDIAATPEAIWPWLVQMGRNRGGFYSYDLLDNGGERSARDIHPELSTLAVGDVLPVKPGSRDGFEVLRLEPPGLLVVGGLFDARAGGQLPFAAERPARFWQVTWAFVLERLDAHRTRLTVRARAATASPVRMLGARAVHGFMQREQLRQLAARAEGRLPRDDWHDLLAGLGAAVLTSFCLLTPFLRRHRSQWGVDEEVAARRHPGDELVPEPRWAWTHGVEIEASAEEVWPWIAQIGADRGGFYSYQWLENLAGCELRNSETLHPEWELVVGDALVLHPAGPPLEVVAREAGRWFVAYGAPDEADRAAARPWATVSWLFEVEPLASDRCRLISRYRLACSDDLPTRLKFGPILGEPVGFVMDRGLLFGVKERAERRHALLSPSHADAQPDSSRDSGNPLD